MKYRVFVKYHHFIEEFDVDIFKNKLTFELINVLPLSKSLFKLHNASGILLDFTKLSSYEELNFSEGDLLVLQNPNFIILGLYKNKIIKWHKFKIKDIFDFLVNSVDNFIFFNDKFDNFDTDLVINSLFNDFIRNDFSSSDFNKRVKYLKVAIIGSFVNKYLNIDFKRIIFDQTILGEINIKDIALSIRFFNKDLVSTYKMSHKDKILIALYKRGILEGNVTLDNSCFVVNKPNTNMVSFINAKHKLQYDLNQNENYVFDIGNDFYEMIFDNDVFYENVTGLVYLYNGNIHDLLIQDEETNL